MKSDSIRILETRILSDECYLLKKITYEIEDSRGGHQKISRECYDRGNGAAVLLYHLAKKTVLLVKQFRMPTFINQNASGFLVEVCAGGLDGDEPEACARRETEEETGYRLKNPVKVYDLYMSPGTVTESLSLFIAEYDPSDKVSDGGGIDDEDIEVLEIPFSDAMQMLKSGEIRDAKTVILLQHLHLSGMMS